MGFSEKIKLEVKKKANFQCCMCRGFIVDVHHIVPTNESGPDTIDNAAPLCGGCHRSYGNNPDHRKTIKQMRDHWYEICERQNNAMPPNTELISEKIDGLRGDLNTIKEVLYSHYEGISAYIKNANSLETITMASSAAATGAFYVSCPNCNQPMNYVGDNEYNCPRCNPPDDFIKAL